MSVVYPTKYKKEQADGQHPKIFQTWAMPNDLNKEISDPSDMTPPYSPNRRKPGVTLPVAGRLPYKIILDEKCADIEKEAVKSLNEVEPFSKTVTLKGNKGRKGKGKKTNSNGTASDNILT